ncbi:Predicted metal-dependent enzyme of the double-stranded beta helix superfamily [Paenibacillus sp. UNCCL117]|uniref:cysteine dioxygenase family protein n=1 Tax=unclassified Paenibacillus TaxID=185978 RepID=UPI00088CB030|nr:MULTISPECIES: cysteine dioxygenase family protein [unclassified Paenibacillus]SDE28661.1 Predicted metal-dependent enzyme of the double-stranded beta helix superfamily [Paenibacillus sp. cl123]SFW63428.1 Predicted metal-dependent enzyme of the double-stranded beta helix superfamily [Paenibacillus sp. UNCCL117]
MSHSYGFKQLERDIGVILQETSDHKAIIDKVKPLLEQLLQNKNLIPAPYRTPRPDKYAQYLLYKPDDEAFSVIAFVWGPGQVAPVHDHLVWGLVGLYEGAVVEKRYRREDRGQSAEPRYAIREVGEVTARRGDISYVYPPDHDIHGVSNPFGEPAITLHIYGADIGKQPRHIHDVATGNYRDIITRHDNEAPVYSSHTAASS